MDAAKRPSGAPPAEPSPKRARGDVAEEPLPVVIDTDPGVDDAMAILLALGRADPSRPVPLKAGGFARPRRLEVLGLTIVHGNLGDVERLARNAGRVLAVAGRGDVPVLLGAHKPLILPAHEGAPFVHGKDGMGDDVSAGAREAGLRPPVAPVPREKEDAAAFIVRQCRERPGQVTVVALGPLTNVALALALEPRLPELARGLVWMGGAVAHVGNVSRLAEANSWNDPHSAHLALNAGWPVVMAPLNVTHRFTMHDEYVRERLRELNHVGKFIHDISRFYVDFFRRVCHSESMSVHDSTAVLALICPELFTEHRQCVVDVECEGTHTRGVTVADVRRTTENADTTSVPRVRVLLDIDADAATAVIEQHYASYSSD